MKTQNGKLLGLGCSLFLTASACQLTGILPDEIDIADSETGATTGGEQNGEGDGDGDDGTSGDGGGDGDGDGDEVGGDGDGDGDGEPGGDGDGDGEAGDGDGDNDFNSCDNFAPIDLAVGSNEVELFPGDSELISSCGGAGPETVYSFTAPEDGTWAFAIVASEFVEVLTLATSCDPLAELMCSDAPALVEHALVQGEVVFVIVDSESVDGGMATLVITLK